jgi:hypothetical protein
MRTGNLKKDAASSHTRCISSDSYNSAGIQILPCHCTKYRHAIASIITFLCGHKTKTPTAISGPAAITTFIILCGCSRQPSPPSQPQFLSRSQDRFQLIEHNDTLIVFNPRTADTYVLARPGGPGWINLNPLKTPTPSCQPGIISSVQFESSNIILNIPSHGEIEVPTNTPIGPFMRSLTNELSRP